MAYAALISLEETIDRLLNSSHISIVPPSRKSIILAYRQAQSLEQVLKRFDNSRESLNGFDRQIREAVCKLEDALESHVSNQFLSQSESLGQECHLSSLSLDLHEIKQDIDSFTGTVKKIKEEHSKEDQLPEDDDDDDDGDDDVSSRIYVAGNKSKVVGFSDQLIYFLYLLVRGLSDELELVSLVGMAGIGKTTLANLIFEHPLISRQFECRAWVRVGPKYQLKKILQGVLAQVNPDDVDKILTKADDQKLDELKRMMCQSLKGRRYLIVLDDVWKTRAWDDLKSLFPDDSNGSRVLMTSRIEEAADSASTTSDVNQMSFLSEEDSWRLLREKVFGEKSCPPELEKAGKKIAENCEGLPLAIVTVADILSKADKTSEFWNNAAEKKNSVFMDAYDQMSKVLLPSYIYLPQPLKACFLYMGVFPQNHIIPVSKLIKLWSADGFLESNPSRTLEYFSLECLRHLVSRSLVIVRQRSSNYGIKTCALHSAFWHLCNREAGKSKFSHVLSSRVDDLSEGIEHQRRLCIQNNILLGIKDVYNSMTSVSNARSVLCTGPPHQYPVPIYFGLMLLRVLDALTIRFYEFPMEVLKLIQLRYLAFTYNGDLPPSISKLWNLKFLIMGHHLRVRSSEAPSYLPMEIWDMQELEHLQITGSNLPDPSTITLLPNLLTLSDVSTLSCTERVFKRIPNLKKLGIRIELAPDHAGAEPSSSCFDHIIHLHELEILKCAVVNPIHRSEVVAPPPSLSKFPSRLRKLTLSGLGYPWEEMSKIASLQNLTVLKLRCCAFRGQKWVIRSGDFVGLKSLLIEDCDLVNWTVGDYSLPWLTRLSLKDCYKLEEIPSKFGEYLDEIEVVDCHPLAMACAKQIKEDQAKNPYRFLDVPVHSSCDDRNLKSS